MTRPVEVKATKRNEKRLPAFEGLGNPHRALGTGSNGFFLFLDPPVSVYIFFVHLFLDQGGLPIATFIEAARLFWAWTWRDSFRSLVQVDASPSPES